MPRPVSRAGCRAADEGSGDMSGTRQWRRRTGAALARPARLPHGRRRDGAAGRGRPAGAASSCSRCGLAGRRGRPRRGVVVPDPPGGAALARARARGRSRRWRSPCCTRAAEMVWVVVVSARCGPARLAAGRAALRRFRSGRRSPRVRDAAAAPPVPDHESAVRRRKGRAVRPGRPRPGARRRGGAARRARARDVADAGPAGGPRRRRPARRRRRGRHPGAGGRHRGRARRAVHGDLRGHPQPLRPRPGSRPGRPGDVPGRPHRRGRGEGRSRPDRRPDVRQQRLVRRVRGRGAEPRLPRRQDRAPRSTMLPDLLVGQQGPAAAAAGRRRRGRPGRRRCW